MKLTQPRMYGRNGKHMWKTPTPKPFEPEGITVGAMVTLARHGHAGQVWAQSRRPGRYWFVADGERFYEVHEDLMTLTGQAFVDDDLFSESA